MQSEYESLVQGIRQCSACSFRNPRIEPLPPAPESVPVSIMFVGENPSWAKDQRIPFAESTPSGQALEENYLHPLHLSRSEVWITDLFKCRYPKRVYDAKTQHSKEIQKVAETCSGLWLLREIEFAKPKVVVTLADKEVYQRLRRAFGLPTPQAFADAVGKAHQVSWGGFSVTLFPMVHPYISRPLGQGDQQRTNVREKWATIHRQEHIPALESIAEVSAAALSACYGVRVRNEYIRKDLAMTTNPDFLSPCGLYCGVCAIYIAHRDHNVKLKELLVRLYKGGTPGKGTLPNSENLSIQDIKCRGCLSDEQFMHCRQCEIRACTKEKGYAGCHQCNDFPCQYIDNFSMAVGKKVILRAVPYRREFGDEKWVRAEEARYICPECGNRVFRGAMKCNQCKTELDLD